MARRQAQQGVLVLGMHRSGTSATAGALEAAGFRLGDRLIEGAVDNPGGYFEHAGVVDVHERLLDALGRAWDDVRAMPDGWLASAPAARAATALGDILAGELAGPVPWVVKDPRACRLLPLWDTVLAAQDTQVGCMFVLRHPDEVAASLLARDRLPPTVSHVLWLRHMVEAEAATRGRPRVLLQYAALVQTPGKVLGDALRALDLPAPKGLQAAVGRVDAKARHHAAGASDEAGPWRALAIEAYEAARASGSIDPVARVSDALLALEREHAGWLGVVGAVQASGQARITRWRTEAAASARHADQLQGRLDEVSALSLSRLRDLEALDAQLSRTTEALQKAEALVDALQSDFGRINAALADTEQLATARLGELRAAVDRATRAEQAKDAAEGLVDGLRREAKDLSGALAQAQAFAADRLQALAATESRIRETEAMLAEARDASAALTSQLADERKARATAEELLKGMRATAKACEATAAAEAKARARAEELLEEARDAAAALDAAVAAEAKARADSEEILAEARVECEALRARVAAEGVARERAESLAVDRLHTLESMDRRMAETAAAKDLAERLAYDRQAELDALSAEVAQLLGTLRDAAERQDRMAERLALLEHGRWWKLGRRLGLAPRSTDRD